MAKPMKEIWIAEAIKADREAHPEWQFGDGPLGERGYFERYFSIEEGMRAYPKAVFHFDPAPEPVQNSIKLSPEAAAHTGRVLALLLDAENWQQLKNEAFVVLHPRHADRKLLREALTALLAPTNPQEDPRATPMKEIWIVEGTVTCLEAHPTAQLGDTEWQFSDGPAGERGYSEDYLSLEEGLRAYPGAIFHFDPIPPTPRQRLEDLLAREECFLPNRVSDIIRGVIDDIPKDQ